MAITREMLQAHIEAMKASIAGYQGAIQFAEMLLETLDDGPASLSVDEFAEMIGGPGATAEIEPAD